MLRVAVCWSGLTRVTDAVVFNKKLFDEVTSDDISFDHYCQFWNSDNRYPYDSNIEELITNQFLELDLLPRENKENTYSIIDILQPKSIVYTQYNSMSWVIEKYYIQSESTFTDEFFKLVKTTTDTSIIKLDGEIANNKIDLTEIWGWTLHQRYSGFVNRLSQFYAFEKSVSLVKASTNSYDVILRMRYDAVFDPDDITQLIESMQYAKTNNTLMVNEFRRYDYEQNKVAHIRGDPSDPLSGTNFGIDDNLFWGETACMFELTSDLFHNASKLHCSPLRLTTGDTAESLWFNVIKNKNIPCQTELYRTYLQSKEVIIQRFLLRENLNLDELKQINFDAVIYNTLIFRYMKPNSCYSDRLSEPVWSDINRYVISPGNYILEKIFKYLTTNLRATQYE